MKNNYLLFLFLSYSFLLNAQSTTVYIPDANFKNCLIKNKEINTNGDSEIQIAEAEVFEGSILCGYSKIKDLTGIEAFPNITSLVCSDNELTSISIDNNKKLERLDVSNNLLTNLDVSSNADLFDLKCQSNKINGIDLTNNFNLIWITCNDNQISSLDLSNSPKLSGVYCQDNANLVNLNVKNGNNKNIKNFDARNTPKLSCINVDTKTVNIYQNSQTTWQYEYSKWYKDESAIYDDDCETIDVIVNIPDPIFKKILVENTEINTNGDEEIQVSEAEAVTNDLRVSGGGKTNDLKIKNLTGIEAFVNITGLFCDNNLIDVLDISNNKKVETLWCQTNELTKLITTGVKNLTELRCEWNEIETLDLSTNNEIISLDFGQNKLIYLNITGAKDLTIIKGTKNNLENIDLSSNVNLKTIWLQHNKLSSFVTSTIPALEKVYIDSNEISTLDFSKNPLLTKLSCKANNLSVLNIQNGNNDKLTQFWTNGSPNLTCILVDDENYSLPVCDFYGLSGWCKDDTSFYKEDCGNVSTPAEEPPFERSIDVHPNPANDILKITLKDNFKIKKNTIHNILGEKIIETNKMEIDMSKLSKGIYLLKVISDDNRSAFRKIMKQ